MAKAKIINAYKEPFPASRFVGKKYTNADRVDGLFGAHWCKWHENNWFKLIDPGCNTPIGLMYEETHDFDTFQYWIGYFMPADTPVPEGFAHVDFPAGELGACWVYGKEDNVFAQESSCGEKLEKKYDLITHWCFERYTEDRFCTPDKKGKVILDICFFIR